MVVVWGCRVVTYLLHVLLLYDQSWCQFGWGGGRGCNHAGTTVFWETLPKANIAVKPAPYRTL